MRTTVDLDEKLLKEARKLTGIKKKTSLLEEGLKAIISKMKREQLISKLGKLEFDPSALLERHKR
jgi:Arc/MetJ family transcription regulator